jgi:hypothetical protein
MDGELPPKPVTGGAAEPARIRAGARRFQSRKARRATSALPVEARPTHRA